MSIRFTFLFSLFVSLSAFGQEKWGLQKAVAYAMANNITVKQAINQAQISQLTYKQAKLTTLPTLGGSLNSSYQRGLNENPTTGTLESASFLSGSVGAQSQYTIFNWGARKSNISAAQLYLEADQAGIDKAQNDIALLVANAFLQVMLRMEQVRISEAAIQLSQAQLSNTRKLVNAGSLPELNALQQEGQLVKDSSALLQGQSLVQEGLITLKAYMNIDIATPFEIDAPNVEAIPVDNLLDLQPADVYALALNNQPSIKRYALQIEAAKKQVSAARANMYPTLSAFGGLNSRYINSKFPLILGVQTGQPTGAFIVDGGGNKVNVLADRPLFGRRSVALSRQLNNNFGQSLGLNLQFPIFNAGSSKTQWKKAQINVLQSNLQQEQEKINLKNNIYTAYQQAYSSYQKYKASTRTVEVSQRALDISKKRYDIGLLGTLDYIITQNNLTNAQIEAVSNRYDFVFKMKVLEFYKGDGIRL